MKQREPIRRFAAAMEKKLQRNDERGGWDNETAHFLKFRLMEELIELFIAIEIGRAEDIQDECVDVGAFAMMLFDVAGQKPIPPGFFGNKAKRDKTDGSVHVATHDSRMVLVFWM